MRLPTAKIRYHGGNDKGINSIQMTYIVYHTQNGVANIILYLHQNIEEEHFMKQEG